ncbi:meckelin-like [Lytechinus variegatus]|uniref:meckelin-like n=1 Tax=Lytechinus variegatus TaxID=7654 RepID=UPI001BB1E1C6|nr:meckelin-like [Lytechinus variegatus]
MPKMSPIKRLAIYFLPIFWVIEVNSTNPFPYTTVQQCIANGEYYNIAELRCIPCGDNQEPTVDGLSCKCTSYFKMTQNQGGQEIECTACPDGQRATLDGWNCIACDIIPLTGECEACPEGEISVEYTATRELLSNRTCMACSSTSQPNPSALECERCPQSYIAESGSCVCPTPSPANVDVCFPPTIFLPNPSSGAFNVPYSVLEQDQLTSWFFQENFVEVLGTCQNYRNFTGCQTWANLCTMVLTQTDQQACQDYRNYVNSISETANGIDEWPADMPWLYYQPDEADMVLSSRDIQTVFTFDRSSLDSQLRLVVAQYTPTGEFLGVVPVTGGKLQFCKDTEEKMNAAYSFATTYRSSCVIPSRDFWDEYETVFFDMYMITEDENGNTALYPIPVLNSNFGPDNRGDDQLLWQLTRRFYLVDNVSGKVNAEDPASALRFASSIEIRVTLREGSSAGLIYPPYLRLTYSELSRELDYTEETSRTVSFSVIYLQDQSSSFQAMSISIGVFCAIFLLYAMAKTNAWRRRAGLIVIDIASMIKFILFSCGLIADALLIVTVGASLYWTLFFKRQDRVYLLLPTSGQSNSFNSYVIVAFVLKFLDVLHLLIVQCRTDIFLIDWERSRGRMVQASSSSNTKASVAPISAWRSFFVANEWNELQEMRRSNPVFQIMAVLFFVEVVGLKNLTTTDPQSSVNPTGDEYIGEYSEILRFGMASGLYILVGVVQWLFYTLIYERFVEDALRNFVDLCSMANISVFVLSQNNYGFYIHGRSVHGFADTNMKEIKTQLKREEDNLVGQRGLEPNTDQQTFEMLLSTTFRERYDSIVLPLRAPGVARGTGAGNNDDKISEAYVSLNKFLSTFIDHGMSDIDYVVKDKLLFEKILDMEFYDPSDKGFFYNDDGHAFQKAIFYGNEATLLVFELLLFCIVDLIFTNYVLAGAITYIVSMLIIRIRDSFGRSNVARKTLVDERFLI